MFIHDQQLDLRRLGYTNNQMLARRKCAILMDAINPEKATIVFEASAGIFALRIGSDQYRLGLVRNAESCLPMSVMQGALIEQPRFTNKYAYDSIRANMLTALSAASMLGVSRPTFLKWVKERNLTVKKVGSQK